MGCDIITLTISQLGYIEEGASPSHGGRVALVVDRG